MDEAIELQKRLIFEHIGVEALQILRVNGIDVDSAVVSILQKKEAERQRREAQAYQLEEPSLDNVMTSELLYRSSSLEGVFGGEYIRRLHLIGLSDEQIRRLYYTESLILTVDSLREQRDGPWVLRTFFMGKAITKDQLPNPSQLTLSELILITDDANAAHVYAHETLSADAWQAVCTAAVQAREARYAYAFKNRVKLLGWSEAQDGAYTKNEGLLLERLKWGHHQKTAWTQATTNLDDYERLLKEFRLRTSQ